MKLVLEIQGEDGTWSSVGRPLSPDDQPGSFSQTSAFGGREIYIFGWLNGEGPALWRSMGGVDDEGVPERVIISAGLELVAELIEGPHEMTWIHGTGRRVLIRLRAHQEGSLTRLSAVWAATVSGSRGRSGILWHPGVQGDHLGHGAYHRAEPCR